MQRYQVLLSALCLAVVSMPSLTFAQARDGRGRGPRDARLWGPLKKNQIVASDQVQQELKITDEQAQELDRILSEHREAREEFAPRRRGRGRDRAGGRDHAGGRDRAQGRGRDRDRGSEDRQAARAELKAKHEALNKETDAKIDAVLNPEQLRRIDEIVLQVQGVNGLVAGRVVTALQLSDEQVSKLREVIKERNEKVRESAHELRRAARRGGEDRPKKDRDSAGRGGWQKLREVAEAAGAEANAAALVVLSEEQQSKLAELKGEPFDLDRRSVFRALRRRGGGKE